MKINVYYVYKKEWCRYNENRGLIIAARDWKRAKGIAMAKWKDQSRNNIIVEEIEIIEGIICMTDYLMSTTEYN